MNEFVEGLSEELQQEKSLSDFKDVDGLAKSYVELSKHMGSSVKVPGDMATEDDWSKFYKRMGRPDSPDAYDLMKPELPEGYEYNNDREIAFREKALQAGLTPKQAKAMYDHTIGSDISNFESSISSTKETKEAVQETLKKVWGADFDRNLGLAVGAIDRFFDEDSVDVVKNLAASNAGVAAALHKIGSAIGEDRNSGNQMGHGTVKLTSKEAWAKIKEAQHDPKSAYRDRMHPGHNEAVEEVHELFKVVSEEETANAS